MTKSLLAFFVATALVTTAVAVAADLPRPAGEFSVHMTNGSQTLLSNYKGKVVVLSFFFTTCPHCQNVAGVMQGIQKEYAPKGVQFMAGCFDDNAANGVGTFNELYVKNVFPVGWDDRSAVFEFLHLSMMQQVFVPIITFIDRKGMLRQQYIGDEAYLKDPNKSIRASLDELLKEPLVSRTPARKKAAN
jgi:cytochrome oxidase Cu insertion factor (SCO1/SenC/PrrC family)